MKLVIHLVSGQSFEQDIDSQDFTIGRSKKCLVVIPHEGMSRQHCRIEFVNGEIFITDLGSTNGVSIDNKKIPPHVRTLYAPYLDLSFGSVQSMQIKLDEPQKSGPASSWPAQTTVTGSYSSTAKTKVFGQSKGPGPSLSSRHRKNSNFMITILILIILGGGIWWFLNSQGDNSQNESIDIEDPQAAENF